MNLSNSVERTCESCQHVRLGDLQPMCGRDPLRPIACADNRLTYIPGRCGLVGRHWQDATVHGGGESRLTDDQKAESRANNSPAAWEGKGFVL
jgi:hypothetical protein